MNKILGLGCLFFSVVLFAYSAIRYFSGRGNSAVYYFIAAVGFLLVYISYRKAKNKKDS